MVSAFPLVCKSSSAWPERTEECTLSTIPAVYGCPVCHPWFHRLLRHPQPPGPASSLRPVWPLALQAWCDHPLPSRSAQAVVAFPQSNVPVTPGKEPPQEYKSLEGLVAGADLENMVENAAAFAELSRKALGADKPGLGVGRTQVLCDWWPVLGTPRTSSLGALRSS